MTTDRIEKYKRRICILSIILVVSSVLGMCDNHHPLVALVNDTCQGGITFPDTELENSVRVLINKSNELNVTNSTTTELSALLPWIKCQSALMIKSSIFFL